MLAVLFGLSMDYEVFLVSRIREEWAATGDNHQAVCTGQATTGRVIIAAATIMILVFSAFILSGQQIIGEIGIGLAAAVLLDAFLLRTLLVPALMHLSGRANWWLPGWLDRILPHLSIEPATQPPGPSPRTRQADRAQHDSPVGAREPTSPAVRGLPDRGGQAVVCCRRVAVIPQQAARPARNPGVPSFRALLLVRVLAAGGSGAGGRRGSWPAVVRRPLRPVARCQSVISRYALTPY